MTVESKKSFPIILLLQVQMRYDSLQLMWDGLPTLNERNKHGTESNNGENNLNGDPSEVKLAFSGLY